MPPLVKYSSATPWTRHAHRQYLALMVMLVLMGVGGTAVQAQLPGRDVPEGCYYFARVAKMQVQGDSLLQEFYYTPLLYSVNCAPADSVRRSIRRAFFYKIQDPNVRENHIELKGPMRDEDDAEEAYWQFLSHLPPESTRHLLHMKLP